jgi:hypothetical protein
VAPDPIADRERFDAAIKAIDRANLGDPNTIVLDGVTRSKELAHAELMTAWVHRLDPDATEAQLLAARANHLRRWTIARRDYPDGRAGYLRWRTALRRQHAREVTDILVDAGYRDEEIDAVTRIISKEGLGPDPSTRDPKVQTHEDALCLVFVQTQLAALADQLGHAKTVDVVHKTLAKMSAEGIAMASEIPLTERESAILAEATGSA